MKHKFINIILILSLLLSLSTAALAQEGDPSFDRFTNRGDLRRRQTPWIAP